MPNQWCRSKPVAILAAVLAWQSVASGFVFPAAAADVAPNDARRQKVEEAIRVGMELHQVPGVSVAIFDEYKILWTAGFGKKRADGDQAVIPETLFQAASISKPIAALGALELVEQGRLDLDAVVNEWLREWKIPAGSITSETSIKVRHLLSHYAGLSVHGFAGYAQGVERPTLLEVLNGEKPANSPPVRPFMRPAYRFSYSGGGYCVLQQLLIETSGQTFPEFMQATVLEPLGMTRSTYAQPLPAQRVGEAAAGHRRKLEVIEGECHVYPEMAAAGLWTTPKELSLAAIDVAKSYSGKGGKLLSQSTARMMLTRENKSYGLGFGLADDDESLAFHHGGSNEGFRCHLVAYPATGQGLAIMTNSDTGGFMLTRVIQAARDAYGWPTKSTEPAAPTVEASK